MAQYGKLQEILKENPESVDLSFYPDSLLNLRSVLSDWVENQDWKGVSEKNEVERAQQCQKLLEEALELLKTKTTPGFELHIRSIEDKVKKAYASEPLQFVEDMHRCLKQEEQLINMAQAMTVDAVSGFRQIPTDQLKGLIESCLETEKKSEQILFATNGILGKWRSDIESNSPELREVFKNKYMPPHQAFFKLKQDLDTYTQKVVTELKVILDALPWHIERWKLAQMYRCVCRKPEGFVDDMEVVEQMCETVCACVNGLLRCINSQELINIDSLKDQSQATPSLIPTPTLISRLSAAVTDIVRTVIKKFFVVLEQPELTMMIEKEKGVKEKDDSNSSKKFSTKFGILGGKGFQDSLILADMEIYLAYNRDIADVYESGEKPRIFFKILLEKGCAKRPAESPVVPYEKTYEKLRVEQFSRKETKSVYKQLYHVVYQARVEVSQLMEEFTAQTYSLPIIVRTGAVQASEHYGALLWHSFSSPNMYDLQAEMAPSMNVDSVIQLINERIAFLGPRGLKDYEQDFLRERLMMATSGKSEKSAKQSMVTLDAFIKDKVALPRHGATNGEKDTMSFSLWRWLHAIINLICHPLKEAWNDEVIFGFASREQCIRALEGDSAIGDGTFLLRFSESSLTGNHMLSKGALAVVVKQDGQAAFAPPFEAEKIEKHGLGQLIDNLGGQILFGQNLTVGDLVTRYPPTIDEKPAQTRYMGFNNKKERYDLSNPCSPASGVASPAAHRPILKGKRRSQNVQNSAEAESKHNRFISPESPSSVSSFSSPTPSFQPVGLKFQQQVSSSLSDLGSPPPPNIPVTVMSPLSAVDAQDGQDFEVYGNSTVNPGANASVGNAFQFGGDQTTFLVLPPNTQFADTSTPNNFLMETEGTEFNLDDLPADLQNLLLSNASNSTNTT